ncbi:MAG: hypothetical protein IJ748_00385 [Bacteroidales bacterium]|nr:hypothetical protein [Bacteroidales bacterium]
MKSSFDELKRSFVWLKSNSVGLKLYFISTEGRGGTKKHTHSSRGAYV